MVSYLTGDALMDKEQRIGRACQEPVSKKRLSRRRPLFAIRPGELNAREEDLTDDQNAEGLLEARRARVKQKPSC